LPTFTMQSRERLDRRRAAREHLTAKAGGESIRDSGKYISIYQRQAAIARENSNNPPFTGR
jgi:hypothetical protein